MNLQDMTLHDKDEQIWLLSEEWKEWLTPEAYEQYRMHSFYDMLISDHPKADESLKEKMKGVRVLAMNL